MIEISQENLLKYYNIALNVVCNVIGKDVVKKQMRKVIRVGISPRAVRRHGVCKTLNGKCIIEISKHLFDAGEKELITTLIHEILHTFKDTKGHDYKWKWYANKISDITEYKITRTRNIAGIESNFNYKVICDSCGHSTMYIRMSDRKINNLKNKKYHCTFCKNHSFKIESLNH